MLSELLSSFHGFYGKYVVEGKSNVVRVVEFFSWVLL